MKTLNEYVADNGIESLKTLLSKELTITEKINGHRLIAKKKFSGKVDFFTKKSKNPIGVIENLVSNLFQDATSYIIKVKDKIPVGELSFYLVKNDLDVKYTNVKSQSLLITNTMNKSNMSIQDIASMCGFRAQEIIFDGVMSEKFIDKIVDYIYNGGILPSIFCEEFGPKANLLNENTYDPIEGYTFNIGGDLYKLEDNRFERHEFKKVNTSNYELLINEIVDSFTEEDIKGIELMQAKQDFRYIEIISNMYMNFLQSKEEDTIDFFAKIPSFNESTGCLNTKYILDERVKKSVADDTKKAYLFKVFIQLFNRDIAERGLITQDTCTKHAALRRKIIERSSKLASPSFEDTINSKLKN